MNKLTEPMKDIIRNFNVGSVATVNNDGKLNKRLITKQGDKMTSAVTVSFVLTGPSTHSSTHSG